MASVSQTANMTTRISKYFKGVLSELKKVHWPNRAQLLTYTGVVLTAVAIVGVIIWFMDSIFSTLLELVL